MEQEKRLKIGDKLEAMINGVDEKGRGLLRAGAKPGLAYFTIPGEKIGGEVVARNGGELRVRVETIMEPSTDRVVPQCPDAGRCGGCPWQHISYTRQCDLKLELINRAFAESGLPETCNLKPETYIRAISQYHYRNRMDYVFAVDGSLGLKTPEHWDMVLDLKDCRMLSKEAVEIMRIVRELTKESAVPFWNNRVHAGFWRYLVIREGKNTGERLVLITTSGERFTDASHPELAVSRACRGAEGLPLREKFEAALKPLATSLLWGINPEITDLSIPKTIEPIFGETYLTEKINGFSYHIPCASFFQTNSEMAAQLQNIVVEFAAPKPGEKIMDLYCGSGFLTLALAKAAERVIGVELDDAAVEIARGNAKLNNIANIDFRSGATEKLLAAALAEMSPDTIVLDPPRAGLHPKALEALMGSTAKRLVYVSCNPRALARDLKTLLTKYAIEKNRCLDLFPHTPHIETVISLGRQ
jgi:23S rRNA (uracil1939-C5)-methyltransferase